MHKEIVLLCIRMKSVFFIRRSKLGDVNNVEDVNVYYVY